MGAPTEPATTPDRITSDSVRFDPTMAGRTDEARRQFIRDQLYIYAESIELPTAASAQDLRAFLYRDFKFRIAKDENLANALNQLAGDVIDDEYETIYLLRQASPIEVQGSVPSPSPLAVDPSVTAEKGAVAKSGDPVNLANGNFAYQTTDFIIPGAGIDFVFTRSYSQLSYSFGPLGYKWDHAYNLWLRLSDGNDVIHVSTGMLQQELFRRHEVHDYWVPAEGRTGILITEGGSFVLRKTDGTRIVFETHPVLQQTYVVSRIEDRFGNYLRLHYSDGLLTSAEINQPDRWVEFAYDDLKRIIRIHDFSGRTWRYDYDDLGDLVAVTSPATEKFKHGTVTSYEYSTAFISDFKAQHNLQSILDADGRMYIENVYGTEPGLLSFNRVICQRQGGGTTYFDYADVVEDFDSDYEVAERPACQTTVTDRDGLQSRYLFNRNGNMVFRETYARLDGVPKLVAWHYRYNRDGNLIATMSPLGVVTQFLFGREYYERQHPQTADYRYESDTNLTAAVRQTFNNLLATVTRGRYYSLASLNLAAGLWSSNIFPTVFQADETDCVQKFVYEPDFAQLLSVSDMRHTTSPDPDVADDAAYHRHLIRYGFNPGNGSQYFHVSSITLPTPHLADGTISSPVVTRIPAYDPKGRPLQVIAPDGLVFVNRYFGTAAGTAEGFLQDTTVDPNGLKIRYGTERDSLGRVITQFSPGHYDSLDGRFAVTTQYDELDRPVLTVGAAPSSVRTTQDYHRSGKPWLTRAELKNEHNELTGIYESLKKYDDELHLVSEVVGDRSLGTTRATKVIFDRAGRISLSIGPSGRKQKLIYDERGLATVHIDDYGGIHALSRRRYDADGRLIREWNRRGNARSYRYNTRGLLVETIDAHGNRLIRRYDKNANLLTECFFERRADGRFNWLSRIECAYDELNRRAKVGVNRFDSCPVYTSDEITDDLMKTGPGIMLWALFFYGPSGNLIQVVDPEGKTFKNEFDLLGRIVKKTDPLGNETVYKYDREGNLLRMDRKEVTQDASTGNVVLEQFFAETYRYDGLNRLIARTNSLGSTSRWAYDSRNRVMAATDPLGNLTEHRYDVFGRRTRSRQYLHHSLPGEAPLPVDLSFEYDADDQMVSHADPLGRITRFRYDSAGRRTSTILPDGSADETRYDAAGNVVAHRDRNGLITTFGYDDLGRAVVSDVEDGGVAAGLEIGGARTYRAAFDGMGRRIAIENDFVRNSSAYNSLGWRISDTVALNAIPGLSPPGALTLTRTFNDIGEAVGIEYPSGRRLSYERDALNRVTAVTQTARGNGYPGDAALPGNRVIAWIEYEGLRRKKVNLGNDTSTEYQHDADERTVGIHHRRGQQTTLRLELLFDAAGNLRQQLETAPTHQRNMLYRYDSRYRICEARDLIMPPSADLSAIAPATQPVPDPIPQRQSAIDELVQESSLPAARRYDYDAQDNRLAVHSGSGTASYQVNAVDQYLTVGTSSYRYDSNGNLIEDQSRRLVYDHRNQLSKTVNKTDLTETHVFRDALGRSVLEVQNGGASIWAAFDGFSRLEEYAGGVLTSSMIYEDGKDSLLASARENGENYFYRDLTGSVRQLFRNHQPARSYEYDEFGNLIGPVDPADTNLIRFQGKRWIPRAEQYDFNSRTYDPAIGRFLQRDPLGLADGPNRYAFVGNNPLTFTDPLGTDRTETTAGTIDSAGTWSQIVGAGVAYSKPRYEALYNTMMGNIDSATAMHRDAWNVVFETVESSPGSTPRQLTEVKRLWEYLEVTGKQAGQMGRIARALGVLDKALNGIGWLAELYGKTIGDVSPAQNTAVKVIDATVSASINTAFSMSHPYIGAIDAAAGLLQEKILGKNYLSISKTMAGATSTISAVGEGILTGDVRGLEKLQEKAAKGEFSIFFTLAMNYGVNYHAKDPDVAHRVETSGEFYGHNHVGRSAAFIAAMPGIGKAGEVVGHAAAITVLETVDTAKSIGRGAERIYDRATDYLGIEFDWPW